MATYAGKLNIGGTDLPIASTLYGTCATAAGTAAKVVTCANFDTLITGVTIHIKFTYANTVASPTLDVNGTGAKYIYRYGTTAPSTSAKTSWNAGSVVSFTYDGTAWIMNDWLNNDTTYSGMSVSEYQAGTSTTARLITPANLKAAINYYLPEEATTSTAGLMSSADKTTVDALKNLAFLEYEEVT